MYLDQACINKIYWRAKKEMFVSLTQTSLNVADSGYKCFVAVFGCRVKWLSVVLKVVYCWLDSLHITLSSLVICTPYPILCGW